MNIFIQSTVRLLLFTTASLSLSAAKAQQPDITPTPQGDVSIFTYLGHTRNVAIGSTPASRAAEAAAALATTTKWQTDMTRGEESMKAGDPEGAINAFQYVLSYMPDDGLAYRRLAEAYVADGRLPEASRAFRKFLIEGFGPGTNGGVVESADEWAEYALVLVKTGQPAEAIRCYNHAASLLDYQDSDSNGGKPHLKVLLPELVAGRPLMAQVQYTPERLQALADTALAISFGSSAGAVAQMHKAVKLYPNSAVTYYYLGEAIPFPNNAGAIAAYKRALELGDDKTGAAAKERIAMYQ